MKKLLILMCMVLMLGLPLTCFAGAGVAEDSDVNGQIDWNRGLIQANGLGFAPTNITNPSQGSAMARRAAVLDAYRNLLETVKGIRIDAETTVVNLAINDSIRAKVTGVIKGAHVIKEEPTADGGYKVTVEIKMYGDDNSLAAAVFNNQGPAQPLPEPVAAAVAAQPALANTNVKMPNTNTSLTPSVVANVPDYTGVVIDARGLGLDRIMSPSIYDANGRQIYGSKFISPEFVNKYGMADYYTNEEIADVTSGKSRAGSNPLIIKATAVRDFNGNVVVSEEDANKILVANKQNGFLTKTAVVFEQ